ncbi:discoidin domain-containing protein [Catalinimonas alkaloidigena]|nr:discoidin domain-containing protein [Catalinimonas alkaloidigena]
MFRKRISVSIFLLVSVFVVVTAVAVGIRFERAATLVDDTKLLLTPAMIVGGGNARHLVDEQALVGDPGTQPGAKPVTAWHPGWSPATYPASIYLDLGKKTKLSAVFLHDVQDIGDFIVSYGAPGQWQPLFTDPLEHYQMWNRHDVNVETRYVRFTMTSPKANVSEVVLYAGEGSGPTPTPAPEPTPAPTPETVWLEAECATVGSNWQVLNEASASAGKYATVKAGMNSKSNAPTTPADRVRFSFSVAEAGDFALFARVNAPNGDDDSFWVRLNGGRWTEWNSLRGTNGFAWKKWSAALNLAKGANTLDFAFREDGALLDKVYLSNEGTPPSGPGGSATNCTTTPPPNSGESAKIALQPVMVVNESSLGDATKLADEQELAGDPRSGSGGAPSSEWWASWEEADYPAHAFIDLGRTYRLTDVYLYDANRVGDIVISAGAPFAWQTLFTDPMRLYNTWKRHRVNVETRYVRVTLNSPLITTPEIVLYGSPVGNAPAPTPTPPVASRPTMEHLMGVNSFIDVPIEIEEVASFVREYHNWNWDEGNQPWGNPAKTTYPGFPNNAIKVNPSYPSYKWLFDEYYALRKSKGIVVVPCMQGSVSWLTPDSEDKPRNAGAATDDPRSYQAHASYLYQYVARYGSKTVDESHLKLAADQPKKTGLNLLTYFEDWNEQDKWWRGADAEFSPYEYAAMASADYDGHQQKMGKTFGVKNADPNAKMVMGGLTSLNLEYVKTMKAWADHYRGGSFPADVLNFHHYCNTGDRWYGHGVSPEEGNLKELLKNLVTYRDQFLPGVEIWLTEFGYDTHKDSPQRAPAFKGFSAEEVQGQWLMRSYLEIAASGIDRATMYMIRDHNTTSGTQYSTSGLVSDKNHGHKPKISWYYTYTMKNLLTGARFVKEINSKNSQVKVYKFRNASAKQDIYAVWCPTSNAVTVDDFELALEGNPASVQQVKAVPNRKTGTPSALTLSGGRVRVNVSERPLFVVAYGTTAQALRSPEAMTETAVTAEESELEVYPNPGVGTVEVHLKTQEAFPAEATYTFLTLNGRAVKTGKATSAQGGGVLRVEGVPAGVYILQVQSGAKVWQTRVVIN